MKKDLTTLGAVLILLTGLLLVASIFWMSMAILSGFLPEMSGVVSSTLAYLGVFSVSLIIAFKIRDTIFTYLSELSELYLVVMNTIIGRND